MKRKTVVSAAPLKSRSMTFRSKNTSPGRARALSAKPKAEAPIEAAPAPEISVAAAPPPPPLPALTEKVYCSHIVEIEGVDFVEINPGGACTIGQALTRAYAQMSNSGGSSEGIASDPHSAFTLMAYDARNKIIKAKLNESAVRMAIPAVRSSNIESDPRFSPSKNFELTGRRSSAHIYVPPPPKPVETRQRSWGLWD